MKNPFNITGIQKAINSLRNNKSPGIDTFRVEQLKYGPEEVSQEIASILNEIA